MESLKKLIGTLFFAFLFIVVMGFLFPKNPEKYLRNQFFMNKTIAPGQYNMVLIGDSRIYRGLSPKTMEENLPGWSVLNFGFSNGGLNPTMFEAAEMKLNRNGTPKIIVMGVTALTLTPESLENRQYLENKRMKREERMELIYFSKIINWFTPISPEGVKTLITKKPEPVIYRNVYHDDGWSASDKFPADTTEPIISYKPSLETQKVSEEILNGLIEQVAKWTKEGIKVFAFRPPLSEHIMAIDNTMAGYNQPEIKRRIEAAGGTWIDVNPTRYKTYDGVHLNSQSAIALSIFMAEAVKTDFVKRQQKE